MMNLALMIFQGPRSLDIDSGVQTVYLGEDARKWWSEMGKERKPEITTVGCLAESLWETEESVLQAGAHPPSLLGGW